MAVQFSGSTIVDTTFISTGTRRDLIDQWETAVVAAGWTAISGAGTADKLYETATTPAGFKVRFRAFDSGSGNCAQFFIKDNSALTSTAGFLLPSNTNVFRIWANKYQFFIFRSGTDMTLQRAFLCGGTLYLPDFMADWMSGFNYQGWMHGIGATDIDTQTVASTWRKCPCSVNLSQSSGGQIWRNAVFGYQIARAIDISVGHTQGNPAGGGSHSTDSWDDGTWWMEEPLLSWFQGVTTSNYYAFKGQLWDAVMSGKNYDSEAVRSIGGTKWRSLTHQAGPVNTTSNSAAGSLLLKTN